MVFAPVPPAPPPQDSVVIQKFDGLKNTVTPERLAPTELERATNVDLDDVGQAHRRRGFTQVDSANYHSVFQGDHAVYAVRNDVLGVINPDYSFTALLSGVGSERLAYVQVADVVYFSSSLTSGKIATDGTVSPWGAVSDAGIWLSPVVNPTDTYHQVRGRMLGRPPMATALAYLNGRIYLAHGQDVWATELYLYDYVDKTRNFKRYESEVTMLGAVTDGIYVGTSHDVWFMSGSEFAKMGRIPIMNYGALPGSLVYVPAELIDPKIPHRPQTESKNAVVFMATTGLCAGMDSGVSYNLTQNHVLFPDGQSVAALFRRQDGVNQYIGAVDSGGTPSSTARIGDYVDAEIRRAI